MKIIDWKKKGNVVRFYLGSQDLEDWYGDDWNDTPYEHNAGEVYDEFLSPIQYKDVAFPFDWVVTEPADDWHYRGNSPFCKDDFKARRAPFLIAIRPKELTDFDEGCYSKWMGADNIYKFYLGDDSDKLYSLMVHVFPKVTLDEVENN